MSVAYEPAAHQPGSLIDTLSALRRELDSVRLPVELPGSAAAGRERASVLGQLDDYILPRLRQLDAPLLVVVGGSTGAGKSTLVNTLVGAPVSRAGVLRPTTRGPVLVCHPADEHWFTDDRVLPGLARTTGDAGDARSLRIVPAPSMPVGLAMLDAPDIDSVVATNRELAASLLAAADLWLFVTTAARYADAVPWDLLHTAAQRSTALAVVLNRIPPGAVEEIAPHLAEMLQRNGLGGTPLLTMAETELVDGALPASVVAPVREWLSGLAADAGQRADIVRGTLRGALDSLRGRVGVIAVADDAQVTAVHRLADEVAAAYDAALAQVEEGVRTGSMLRGEVLARWQEYVGTGEFMRTLESRIGVVRDRVWASITGRRPAGGEVRHAVEASVEELVAAAADAAAERLYRSWETDPAGRSVLRSGSRDSDLSRSSPELRGALGGEVRDWQGYVLRLVSEEGADKRFAARAASLGVNGAGLALMLAVFAQTGGLSGGEIAVAGGTSIAGQRLLEAVFGDEAVRRLAAQARVELLGRVSRLLAADAGRYTDRIEAAGEPTGDRLRAALAAVEVARRDEALT